MAFVILLFAILYTNKKKDSPKILLIGNNNEKNVGVL